jgi:ATP-dependent DNA helicase DinG
VLASHGHAAVLFTSYSVMGKVCAALSDRNLPFPFFRMDKGGAGEIERFKRSGNGVLFASGAMWEGVDIPGDTLSMLIIVKLPFPQPNPVSRYELSKVGGFSEYREKVIIPETVISAKQAFGRLHRLESDTGVVAFLDSRMRKHASYRSAILNALPRCEITDSHARVRSYYMDVKPHEYFRIKPLIV